MGQSRNERRRAEKRNKRKRDQRGFCLNIVKKQRGDYLVKQHDPAPSSEYFEAQTENQRSWSSMSEVQQYFSVPDKDARLMQNENLAGFIVFLLQVLDQGPSSYADDRQEHLYALLREKLTFLLTFLGDAPFQCTDHEDINNALQEFESLANEAGRFIYSCVSASSEVMMDEAFDAGIQAILGKIDTLNAIIKELSFRNLQEPATSRSNPVHSAFIIDSLLDDIEGLMNGLVGVTCDDIKDQIQTLVGELNFSKTFVRDVKVPQVTNSIELKESLIHIIIDATYEAEYLINSYTVGHAPSWYLNLRLPVVVQKINLTRTRLQGIDQINGVKNMKIDVARNVTFKEVKTPQVVQESIIVGFEEVTEKILDDLTGGSERLHIISIIGMPGIGKTTLAKKLYDDRLIREHFYLHMWCIVSQTYLKKKVFHDILMCLGSSLGREKLLEMEDESLGLVIYQTLKGRKYLIVIDDVWDSSTWDDFRRCLPDDGNGSRVVLTSRIKDSAPSDSIFHSPPALSESQCYDLLLKKVFKNEPCPSMLSSILKGIASKCHGLPLAVVVVAGILANLELEETAWKNVKGSLDSCMLDDSSIRIMELSYKHLPSHLKPCFLFLGTYDHDTEIPIGNLTCMWIAQGFVQKEEDNTVEHVAGQYLLDLINRSLLMISKRKSDGEIKTCRIHGLLNEMRLHKAKEEKFLHYIDQFSTIYQKYSHLALYDMLSNTCSISAPHCRSLYGIMVPLGHSVGQMPLLRVMHLLPDGYFADEMKRICHLVHLRYLSFYGAVPRDICKLVNLEYLRVKTNSVVYVPSTVLNMVKMRHISITSEAVFVFDTKGIMSQITNNINSLSRVRIRNHKEEKILKCSPYLRKLKCVCDGLFPNLTSHTDLESLSISNCNYPLRGEQAKINFPATLKKVTLSGTCLPWEETAIVGRLPNLRVLKLLCDAFVGEEWETRDGEFQKLMFLKLCNIISLRQWATSNEHFPELQCLVLDHVAVQIPSEFGDIETLHTIEVRNCGQAVYASAIQIEEEQQDYGNEYLKIITSDGMSQFTENKLPGSYFDKEELDRPIALSIPEKDKKGKSIIDDSSMEEGELLAKAPQDSSDGEESPPIIPQYDYGSIFPPYPFVSTDRVCAGCNKEIKGGKYSRCMGSDWHDQCFRCHACKLHISEMEFKIFDNCSYHNSCFKEPGDVIRCYVCKDLVSVLFRESCAQLVEKPREYVVLDHSMQPSALNGRFQYLYHSFWLYKYCPSHETDGTPICCGCVRMEPVDNSFFILDDGRKLCLECLESSIMDTDECQSLYLQVRDFYEGLNMKVEQQFPLFLVENQVLDTGNRYHLPSPDYMNTSLCLFDQQGKAVTTPNSSSGYYRLLRECEVTAILVLYGLPRLFTGQTIVFLMMKVWLRLEGGYWCLDPDVEECICLILAHMWLEAEVVAGSSKKGKRSEFEKKLGECCKDRIESDASKDYGDCFREGMAAVEKYGLRRTLDHIRLSGAFPC